ncbi:uncharacterized protein LOC129595826 [Paramacrobiotus metropolitanus]|uniref:uncharacterized protein LOC129595826 n=1 Tax=Paramacrobiotus metropolitanus TaxID=2943436 RepID=UPI0024464011|nr:uncharacterized protein LOC129595826 [Paramacrobiotus metropolitanus]
MALRQGVPVTLYLDFGTAYIKAAIQCPDGEVKPLSFNGQNALPAYLFLSSEPGENFVGLNARELSNTSTRNIVLYPALFLRKDAIPTACDSYNSSPWVDFAMPFTTYVQASGLCSLLVGATGYLDYDTATDKSNRVLDGTGAWINAVKVNRAFLNKLREICQEQDDQYSIVNCVIAVHELSSVDGWLRQALHTSVFEDYHLKERSTAQITGLLRQFPSLRKRSQILVLRMGAAFSTLCVYTTQPEPVLLASWTETFGGNNIDVILVQYCLKKFVELYRLNGNVQFSVDNLHRLRLNCEAVKIQLSTTKAVTLRVNQFFQGGDLVVEMTSEIFRDLVGGDCYKALKTLVGEVDRFFSGQKRDFELVLVGGTSKIPLVQDIVTWTLQKPNQQVRSVMDGLVISGLTRLPPPAKALAKPASSAPRPSTTQHLSNRRPIEPATTHQTLYNTAPSASYTFFDPNPFRALSSGQTAPQSGSESYSSGSVQTAPATTMAPLPNSRLAPFPSVVETSHSMTGRKQISAENVEATLVSRGGVQTGSSSGSRTASPHRSDEAQPSTSNFSISGENKARLHSATPLPDVVNAEFARNTAGTSRSASESPTIRKTEQTTPPPTARFGGLRSVTNVESNRTVITMQPETEIHTALIVKDNSVPTNNDVNTWPPAIVTPRTPNSVSTPAKEEVCTEIRHQRSEIPATEFLNTREPIDSGALQHDLSLHEHGTERQKNGLSASQNSAPAPSEKNALPPAPLPPVRRESVQTGNSSKNTALIHQAVPISKMVLTMQSAVIHQPNYSNYSGGTAPRVTDVRYPCGEVEAPLSDDEFSLTSEDEEEKDGTMCPNCYGTLV